MIQRLIENSRLEAKNSFIKHILNDYEQLLQYKFGTFVLCCILQNGLDNHKCFLLEQMYENMASMSIDRNGSKLIENCLKMKPKINDSKCNEKDTDEVRVKMVEIFNKFVNLPILDKDMVLTQMHEPAGSTDEVCFS